MRFPTPAEGIIMTMIMCFLYTTRYSYTISKFVGYFYLVDLGDGYYKGFLPSYRNERYHLDNFRGSQGEPKTVQEVFNYRHSSLRSVVERMFGIMKNRFPIMNNMLPYPILYQRLFVIACCTIHDFIRKDCGETDSLFKEALEEMYGESWVDVSQQVDMPVVPYVSFGQRPNQSQESSRFMGTCRNTMSNDMW
jgi:hypothetical protein